MSALKSHSRGVIDLTAHLVLLTKYRKKVISKEVLSRLTEIIFSTCFKWNCKVLKVNGESDHMHVCFSYYPQMQLSKFINNLKTVTSRLIRKEFASHVDSYYKNTAFWNESYFIGSCDGVTIENSHLAPKYVDVQSLRSRQRQQTLNFQQKRSISS